MLGDLAGGLFFIGLFFIVPLLVHYWLDRS